MTNTNLLNQTRRNAEITCTEFADFLGMCRRHMVRVELGLEPTHEWMFSSLQRMIAQRA